ncbi:PREDICTED: ankyrin repeat and MYND domain-containing protein 2-like isoform X2 [Amphimedon queenslandica]|uniref:MYND-type domain-containing protein n=1 Tax=Amphimedon queenslandica TaxID=400682 RepID=A0A1X7UJL9_AMPQE|nr:PREDICTED: ankyrin repeat and MYND domain-containing protein 2-like isoform X2 [Amphimedon queenslandica]|eukprot:XP_019853820.1 PREDICTED: ankyrin repeat and MYND domain-containing protein 2-like isoform X2 [Amphimedon queenslandica]
MATSAQNEAETKLIYLCSKENKEVANILTDVREILDDPSVRVDATDKDGMTGLMHAAFGGNVKLCKLLIEKGADVNSNLHSQGYTALMFATISGSAPVVQLLLEKGASVTATNNVNRTAAQMGGFVGQRECVNIINGYFPIERLKYYTQPQGLETSPKLDPVLLEPLHSLITNNVIHPVKFVLLIKDKDLHRHQHQVCSVLRILIDKSFHEDNEPFSLKLHLIWCTVKECNTTGTDELLKKLLQQTEDCKSLEVEKYLRLCIKSYPHVHSVLFKQLVQVVADTSLGDQPTTLTQVIAAIQGNRGFIDQESCSTCGTTSKNVKKCSKCKKVWYCNVECQRLSWTLGNHKKLCKIWSGQNQEKSK